MNRRKLFKTLLLAPLAAWVGSKTLAASGIPAKGITNWIGSPCGFSGSQRYFKSSRMGQQTRFPEYGAGRVTEYCVNRSCGHKDWVQSPGVADPMGWLPSLDDQEWNGVWSGLCGKCRETFSIGYSAALEDRERLDRLSSSLSELPS